MEYMLLIYSDNAQFEAMSPSQQSEGMAAYGAYTEALQKAGVLRGSNRLRPAQRRHHRAPRGRQDPGAERPLRGHASEQLGGYYLIDVPDLDAALSWAARCPGASHGAVEVRPIWPMGTLSRVASDRTDARARGRGRRAAQLRQARRLPRRAHARRGGGRGRAVGGLRRGARRLAACTACRERPRPGCSPSRAASSIDAVRRRRLRRRRRASSCAARRAGGRRGRGRRDARTGASACCSPARIPASTRGVRAPLMLQVVLGFDAATIASAFLVAPAAMGQRLARAKAKIRAGRHRLRGARRAPRCASGSTRCSTRSTPPMRKAGPIRQGADARRRNLADEAIWLGRLVASLLPEEAARRSACSR